MIFARSNGPLVPFGAPFQFLLGGIKATAATESPHPQSQR